MKRQTDILNTILKILNSLKHSRGGSLIWAPRVVSGVQNVMGCLLLTFTLFYFVHHDTRMYCHNSTEETIAAFHHYSLCLYYELNRTSFNINSSIKIDVAICCFSYSCFCRRRCCYWLSSVRVLAFSAKRPVSKALVTFHQERLWGADSLPRVRYSRVCNCTVFPLGSGQTQASTACSLRTTLIFPCSTKPGRPQLQPKPAQLLALVKPERLNNEFPCLNRTSTP